MVILSFKIVTKPSGSRYSPFEESMMAAIVAMREEMVRNREDLKHFIASIERNMAGKFNDKIQERC